MLDTALAQLCLWMETPKPRVIDVYKRQAEGVVEPDAVGLDHRHVALLEDAVAAGVLEQGRNIGGHEVLTLAPAHDEGALLLDGVDGVRLIPEPVSYTHLCPTV